MAIFLALLWAIFWIAVILLGVAVILWLLGLVGISPPAKVVQLIWAIAVILCVIVFVSLFVGRAPFPAYHIR